MMRKKSLVDSNLSEFVNLATHHEMPFIFVCLGPGVLKTTVFHIHSKYEGAVYIFSKFIFILVLLF